MSLKKKLLLLLLVSCFILALTFQISFEITLFPSLKDQKEIFSQKQEKKFNEAWQEEEESIDTLFKDWFDLDAIAGYIKDPTEKFEQRVFKNEHFVTGMMNFVVILTLETKVVFYKNFHPDAGFIDIKRLDIIGDMNKIRRVVRRKLGSHRGVVNTIYGPIMVVAHPIFDRGHLNRMEGIMILGKYVDERMIERISFYVTQEVKKDTSAPEEIEAFYREEMKGKNVLYIEDVNAIKVYLMLKDINELPVMLLYTETDNRLFNVVKRQMITYAFITIFLIICLGIMLYFSIDKYIIKRMLGISDRMSQIEGLNDLSIRIDSDEQNDEVSHLISNINLSLDRLEQEIINREKAEKSLIQQGKLASIGRLTSSIAHEINNPLMAIGNSLQVIKKMSKDFIGDSDDSLLGEAVDISESEVERIKVIISGLLDFHRMDKEDFARVNLNKVVLQSLSILSWSKKLGDVEIVSELEEDHFIMGAPVRLKQVFINFILNAAEAMGNSGGQLRVGITTSLDGDYAEVHFKDTGPGLSPDVKGSMFEPFVSTKEDKGVGLGLFISYKIIKNHKGDIVYNDECHEGAHFIIQLPLVD